MGVGIQRYAFLTLRWVVTLRSGSFIPWERAFRNALGRRLGRPESVWTWRRKIPRPCRNPSRVVQPVPSQYAKLSRGSGQN